MPSDDQEKKGQGSDVLDVKMKLDSEDSTGCLEQTGREVPKAGKPVCRRHAGCWETNNCAALEELKKYSHEYMDAPSSALIQV